MTDFEKALLVALAEIRAELREINGRLSQRPALSVIKGGIAHPREPYRPEKGDTGNRPPHGY